MTFQYSGLFFVFVFEINPVIFGRSKFMYDGSENIHIPLALSDFLWVSVFIWICPGVLFIWKKGQ